MLSTATSAVYSCKATNGGAAYLVDSQVSSLSVHGCVASDNGGGIVVTGRSVVDTTRISACHANGNAGAVWVAAYASAGINDTILAQNTATNTGGAVHVVASGALVLGKVVFTSNSAASHGACAVYRLTQCAHTRHRWRNFH